jgi:hypothetical protein
MDEKQLKIEMRAAIKRGDLEEFSRYYEENVALRDAKSTFGTWLHMAASYGHMHIVSFLVQRGCDIDINAGIRGGSPLNDAASEGRLDIVKFLLSKGAKMDVSDPRKNPLFGAVYKGDIEIVRTLIKCGIDYRVKYTGENMVNMDAEMFARERGASDIADYLGSLG